MCSKYEDIKKRFKENVELSEDKSIATVTFKFRGLGEAEAFLNLVRNVLRLSSDFIEESDEMDKLCKEHNCRDF